MNHPHGYSGSTMDILLSTLLQQNFANRPTF